MGTAASSLGERGLSGGQVGTCCDGFRLFSIGSGYYFLSVGKLIQQQIWGEAGGIILIPALSNALLFLSLEGDPEHWGVGQPSLGFRLLLSLALVR